MGIGMVIEKTRNVSMQRTVLPLMADMNVEDNVAENTSGSGAELISAGKNTCEQGQISLESACIVRDSQCQRLLEDMKQSREDTSQGVHSLVCGHRTVLVELWSSQI